MRTLQAGNWIFGAVMALGLISQLNALAETVISGTVRDSSGQPAAGVMVSFYPRLDESAPNFGETNTDQNGRYELHLQNQPRLLPPGRWNEFVINHVMARDSARNLAAIRGFTDVPTNVDLVLQPGLLVTGSIIDTNGVPIANVNVGLMFGTPEESQRLTVRPYKSDANGSFSIPALPHGFPYVLSSITAPGYGSTTGVINAEATYTNHFALPTFVLKKTDRELSGQVLLSNGKPVAGATVSMSGPGQPVVQGMPLTLLRKKTDDQGRFTFYGVCEGPVDVRVVPPLSLRIPWENGLVRAQGGDTNIVVTLQEPPAGDNDGPPKIINSQVSQAARW